MTRNGDDPFASPNPHRLYRNRDGGLLFGVCAGIAEYLGVGVALVRVVAALGLVFLTAPTLILYLVLAVALPTRPPRLFRSHADEMFWRTVSAEPSRTLSGLRHRWREMERRLAGLEGYVASKEYALDRAIKDLER